MTVLIPPAVDAGEPPINIKIHMIIFVAGLNSIIGTLEKPAVRVVVDWKKLAANFCPNVILPIVAILLYSIARKRIVPPINSMNVVTKTSFECKCN